MTTGDPFRADDSGDETELEVFDRHPDVLLGVNESIPPFGVFVEALVENEDRVTVRFLTTSLWCASKVRWPRLPLRRRPRETPRVVVSQEEAPLHGKR